MWGRTVERRRALGVGLSLGAVCVLLGLHYGVTLHSLGLHDLLRRFFYLPVIAAAIAGGMRGGLLVAAAAAIGYLPHLRQLAAAGDRVLDHALELLLLPLIGVLVGGFADSSRRARALAAERGRLAALGEVGVAILAQIEGPLSSIAGQAESLEFTSRRNRDGAAEFATRVIRDEIARLRHLLTDLRGLGRAGGQRVAAVNLAALLGGLVNELRTGRSRGPRIVLVSEPKQLMVRANRAALAYSLRSLLLGLLDAVSASDSFEIALDERNGDAVLTMTVRSSSIELPDLESGLGAVFGAEVGEYHFRQALCVHLLTAEGAAVRFRRVSPREAVVIVRLPRDEAESGPASRSAERQAAGVRVLSGKC